MSLQRLFNISRLCRYRGRLRGVIFRSGFLRRLFAHHLFVLKVMDGSSELIDRGAREGNRDIPASGVEGQDPISRKQRRICDLEVFNIVDGIGLLSYGKTLLIERESLHIQAAFDLIVHSWSP